jgi:hypothetical protein
VGLEASRLCTALPVTFWIFFNAWFREVKYPHPAEVPENSTGNGSAQQCDPRP